jgi:hypothetical protein
MPDARVKSFLVLAGLTLTIFAPWAHGQALGVEYGVTYAGYDGALERPTGVGGTIDLPIGDHLGVRLRVTHQTENLVVRRSPCTGLPPPGAECTPEPFDGDAELTTYGAGMVARLPPLVSKLRAKLYALALAAEVTATFRGRRSGKQIRPITPEGRSPGLEVGGSLGYAVSSYVSLQARVGTQFVYFGVCGSDAWVPFCDSHHMPRLALGVQVRLSRLGSE